ncbi:MAG: HlyD family secretion protein, partial [Pseudomonas marincola]
MSERLPPSQVLLSLTALRDRALAATTLNALAFSMANDVYPLLDYRQALVMAKKGSGLELLCVSGLAKPTEDSPYLIWLERASRWLLTQIDGDKPQWVSRSNVTPPEEVATGWSEWWPEGVYCVPLKDPSN